MYVKKIKIGDDKYKVKDEDARNDISKIFESMAEKAYYEEGIWTPELYSTENMPTYNLQIGTYKRVGKIVFCSARVNFENMTAVETLTITGLPYAIDTLFKAYSPVHGSIYMNTGLTTISGSDCEYTSRISEGIIPNTICAQRIQDGVFGYIYPLATIQEHDIDLNFWYITTGEKIS